MIFNGFKAFLTDHMFHTAGILCCCFFIYTKAHEPVTEKLMTFIDHISDLLAGWSQVDIAFFGNCDVILFAEIFHGNTDT